jgi:hypothetical protein
VHINLSDVDEDEARSLLLDGVNAKRTKPSRRPSFPGTGTKRAAKTFPGPSSSAAYMPKLKQAATDAERRRYVREAFNAIKAHFEQGLDQLARQSDAIECDFQLNMATDFTAEVFVNGQSRCHCRVWQGGLHSPNGISYAEGSSLYHGTNACNEILSINDEQGALHISALMAMGFGQIERDFNLQNMNRQQAADYLWRRFLLPLER